MRAYTSPRKTSGFFRHQRLIIGILGVVVAAAILLVDFIYNRHDIRIFADGKEISIVMRDGTVEDSIAKARLNLAEHDVVEPSPKTVITGDQKVTVTRMMPVNVVADGQTELYWVPLGSKVKQVLQDAELAFAAEDLISPGLDETVSAGGDIEVVRVAEKIVQESIKVPFNTIERKDSRLDKGLTRIIQKGKDGLLQKTIKITLKNGQEISRELVGETTVQKPIDKIVAVGAQAVKTVSRGSTIKYSKVIEVNASAYTHTGNNMSTGIYPHEGAVAVDPKVIPLGTELYVEGYGYAKALDTGGAIRGNKIDVFFDTRSEALKWGRRNVKVYILQ